MISPLSRLLLLALLLPASCSPPEGSREIGPSHSETAENTAGFPRTIATFAGQNLELPSRPVRILPANGSALDFVLSVCEPGRVVALSPITLQYSVGAHELGLVEALEERATLGQWSVESALTLDPDLVLVGSWQDETILAALERAQVPVLRLPDVAKLEDILAILEVLGRAFGEEERAAAESARLKEVANELASAEMPSKVRALSYSNFGSGGSSAGTGTTYDLLFQLAQLENAAASHGMDGFGSLSFEELLTLDPDWILVGEGYDETGLGSSEQFLSESTGYDQIPAVQAGRFLRLKSRLYSTNSLWLIEAARRVQVQVLEQSELLQHDER